MASSFTTHREDHDNNAINKPQSGTTAIFEENKLSWKVTRNQEIKTSDFAIRCKIDDKNSSWFECYKNQRFKKLLNHFRTNFFLLKNWQVSILTMFKEAIFVGDSGFQTNNF